MLTVFPAPAETTILPHGFPIGGTHNEASVINSSKIDIIVLRQTIYGFVSITLEREGY
jgi:hypothetical protein